MVFTFQNVGTMHGRILIQTFMYLLQSFWFRVPGFSVPDLDHGPKNSVWNKEGSTGACLSTPEIKFLPISSDKILSLE